MKTEREIRIKIEELGLIIHDSPDEQPDPRIIDQISVLEWVLEE